MQAPTADFFQALKHVLLYLKSTIQHGLHLKRNSSLHLHAYCDADSAGDTSDRRSTGA